MLFLRKDRPTLVVFLLPICLLFTGNRGNQYDPHVYPSKGPFFEGWYMRLQDTAQSISVGFLFGRVLPKMSSPASQSKISPLKFNHHVSVSSDSLPKFKPPTLNQDKPLVIASVLVQDPNVSRKLQVFDGIFPVKDYSVTVKGKPVIHNPDDRSPPDFKIKFGNNGSVVVTANQTMIDVCVDNVRLFVRAVNPVPWGPGGEGPEGWLKHLPLPLHWFVYSLRSSVTQYKFTNFLSRKTVSGKNAHLHMEKNWGKSFPTSWIWSQGTTSTNITLALSGGILDFVVLNVTAFLVGYKNPAKNIAWNFTPSNSIVSFSHNACDGVISLNLTSLEHWLNLKIISPVESFSSCLLGPEKNGFRRVCVESYDAVTHVKAFKRDLFNFVQVDESHICGAALEFGGQYVCKDKCSHS